MLTDFNQYFAKLAYDYKTNRGLIDDEDRWILSSRQFANLKLWQVLSLFNLYPVKFVSVWVLRNLQTRHLLHLKNLNLKFLADLSSKLNGSYQEKYFNLLPNVIQFDTDVLINFLRGYVQSSHTWPKLTRRYLNFVKNAFPEQAPTCFNQLILDLIIPQKPYLNSEYKALEILADFQPSVIDDFVTSFVEHPDVRCKTVRSLDNLQSLLKLINNSIARASVKKAVLKDKTVLSYCLIFSSKLSELEEFFTKEALFSHLLTDLQTFDIIVRSVRNQRYKHLEKSRIHFKAILEHYPEFETSIIKAVFKPLTNIKIKQFLLNLLSLKDEHYDLFCKNCHIENIIYEILMCLHYPYYIYQEEYTLCGPATVLTLWAKTSPALFVQVVTDLVINGKSKINTMQLTVNQETAKNANSAILIAMTSLRHSSNHLGYALTSDKPVEALQGATRPKAISRWLAESGYLNEIDSTIVRHKKGHELAWLQRALIGGVYSHSHKKYQSKKENFAAMCEGINRGGHVILYITYELANCLPGNGNFGQAKAVIRTKDIRQKQQGILSIAVDHYVNVESVKQFSKNKIEYLRLNLYSYGTDNLIIIRKSLFLEHYLGAMIVSAPKVEHRLELTHPAIAQIQDVAAY